MAIRIGSTVLDVADVARAARFWCALLGYEPRDGPDREFMVLIDPRHPWSNLSLQRSDEPKHGVNRVHLDLYADDQEAEIKRVEKLGGKRVPWEYQPGDDHVVMADPDGNEFCVVQRS